MEELIRRYDELYNSMAIAKDPKNMVVFGEAEKWAFHMLAEKHPEIAEKWLARLEAGKWNNYLSKSEAEFIASKLINQDGSHGPHWSYDAFKGAVESIGGNMKDEPFYNCYALWVEANTLWSDIHKSLSKYISKEQEPEAYYHMAVEKLKDVDRPKYIREYFDL